MKKSKSVLGKIRDFDAFGAQPSLKFNRQRDIKSWLGALCTAVLGVLFLYFGSIKFKQMYARENELLTIVDNSDKQFDEAITHREIGHVYHMEIVNVSQMAARYSLQELHSHAYFKMWWMDYLPGSYFPVDSTEFAIELCDPADAFQSPFAKNYYDSLPHEDGDAKQAFFCFEDSIYDAKVKADLFNGNSSQLLFAIGQCIPSEKNNFKCIPEEQQKLWFEGASIQLKHFYDVFNSSRYYEKPFYQAVNTIEMISIDIRAYTWNQWAFRETQYTISDSFFFGAEDKYSVFKVETPMEVKTQYDINFQYDGTLIYAMRHFGRAQSKTTVKRLTYNLENILTELGGLLEAVFIIIEIVMSRAIKSTFGLKILTKLYIVKSKRTDLPKFPKKKGEEAVKQQAMINDFQDQRSTRNQEKDLVQVKWTTSQRIKIMCCQFWKCLIPCVDRGRYNKIFEKGCAAFDQEIDLVKMIQLLRYVKYLKANEGIDKHKEFRITYLEQGLIDEHPNLANGERDITGDNFSRRRATVTGLQPEVRQQMARDADEWFGDKIPQGSTRNGDKRKADQKDDPPHKRRSSKSKPRDN